MRSVNRRDLRRSRMAAVAGLPGAPFSDDHEDPPRCAVSACPRGDRGASGTRAETWGRSSLRQPSASAGRHLASTLRRAARLRSSRPQDSAPADGRGAPAPSEEMGTPSGHSLPKRSWSLHSEEHQPPTPTWATYDVDHEVNTGSRGPGSCADFRPPRKRAAHAVSARPRGGPGHPASARRLGPALRFADRPPSLAAIWRARCGGRLGCAPRVPKTPRRPPLPLHPSTRASCATWIVSLHCTARFGVLTLHARTFRDMARQ